jgi:hypothetical protein
VIVEVVCWASLQGLSPARSRDRLDLSEEIFSVPEFLWRPCSVARVLDTRALPGNHP